MHPDTTHAFDHALALPPVDTRCVAGRWHHDRVALKGRVHLESENFPARIARGEAPLACERAALDHLDICYERDLATPEIQIATVERLCAQFGTAPEPFEIPLQKVLPTDPEQICANFDEIRTRLMADGYGHLLPYQDGTEDRAAPATERGFQ